MMPQAVIGRRKGDFAMKIRTIQIILVVLLTLAAVSLATMWMVPS